MPHIIETLHGLEARQKALETPPLGPGLTIIEWVDRLELWGSSFSDPGDDWCEWRIYDAEGAKRFTHRIPGY